MRERQVIVGLAQGLHARPATLFVKVAASFSSEIGLNKDEKKVNAKSIIGVMSLAVSKGQSVVLTADGADAEQALDALERVLVSVE
ncbi:HPr family phosphocarrier protein [Brevibacillus sp. HB1.2]|uniref:Phosphocarrier protein HPr n=2 Tax=Brevibacillus TaxID=55080 RepID=A0A517I4U9_BREBE|nr:MULTISPECIES: HPr family phosphocarrier protein [Brevibacillus]ATF13856.1 HPr family phosphocarrier protein [Brevibacillus brevis X23]MDC0759212.1 HPr family phosphocarrier protein [Brevibacillus sp. AG]MED1798695.1 HPr family phosphocarrier protein [Brevibacillus porteri]MED2131378.1 HPr family phosphocarrier protein [Brevibacillus porteri]MED2743932.1 HPr family phosphocarrier protein [Brevibacillus porteri]